MLYTCEDGNSVGLSIIIKSQQSLIVNWTCNNTN